MKCAVFSISLLSDTEQLYFRRLILVSFGVNDAANCSEANKV